MKCTIQEHDVFTSKADCVIVGCFEHDFKTLAALDKKLNDSIKRLFDRKEFTGELFQHRLVQTCARIPAEYILLIGLGKQADFNAEKLRKTSALATRILRTARISHAATTLHTILLKELSAAQRAQTVTEGALLANYQYTTYKTIGVDKIFFLETLDFLSPHNKKEFTEGINQGNIIAQAQCWVRDLVNTPPSVKIPEHLAKLAQTLPKTVKITILDKKQTKDLGMGGLLAVNAGSIHEPRFVIAEYKNSTAQPIALVGKGITFDSGGISIKPSANMDEMKMDMAGAATVLGTLKAIAELKLPLHVIGFAPITENLPSGSAYKPGDIVTTFNKKTIEILNTDAEGRVILADALAYAETKKPQAIIDLATLTGACIVALGTAAAGLVGTNDDLIKKLQHASTTTHERVWHLPLYDDYKELVKSDIADVKNLGHPKGDAGALTAAAFLNTFVTKTPWAHLDIAGPAWSTEEKFYWTKGGTGFGVRLLVELLKNWKPL